MADLGIHKRCAMTMLITHWAKLALLESAQRSHDVIQTVCNDAIYVTQQNSVTRSLRCEVRADGKTEVLFVVSTKDGESLLDVRWRHLHSDSDLIISPNSVTIGSLPASIVSAFASKAPFPIEELIDNSPYNVLLDRKVIEVATKANNAIFHLEERTDCQPTDLRAWQRKWAS